MLGLCLNCRVTNREITPLHIPAVGNMAAYESSWCALCIDIDMQRSADALRKAKVEIRAMRKHLPAGTCLYYCLTCEDIKHHWVHEPMFDAAPYRCRMCQTRGWGCTGCEGSGLREGQRCAACDGEGTLPETTR